MLAKAAFAAIVLVLCVAHGPAHAQWTIQKIADFTTPVPGRTANFSSFGNRPAIDNGTVVFQASGGGLEGIYRHSGGSLSLVVDESTPVPGATGTFDGFSRVSMDGTNLAFGGVHSYPGGPTGVYALVGGILSVVADKYTPIPEGTGNFVGFVSPSIDGADVAFSAYGGSYEEGIYTNLGGNLSVVADFNTLIPGGTGTFTSLGSQAFVENGTVTFSGGRYPDQSGLYRSVGGSLVRLYDRTTPVPAGIGTFTSVGVPVTDGGSVAFKAMSSSDQEGIYTNVGGSLGRLVDKTVAVPDGVGNFTNFDSQLSLDSGNVAFLGFSASRKGIYASFGGALTKVVDNTDILDGKTLLEFGIGPQALSGDQIVFRGRFVDYSEALYVATIPEPAALALLGLGGLALVRRRR